MKRVNFNKQFKGVYTRYKNSDLYRLEDCYDNHSYAKQGAYNYCIGLVNKYNGFAPKIIGYNCMNFSFGFEYIDEDGLHFVYITKDYDRDMLIENV